MTIELGFVGANFALEGVNFTLREATTTIVVPIELILPFLNAISVLVLALFSGGEHLFPRGEVSVSFRVGWEMVVALGSFHGVDGPGRDGGGSDKEQERGKASHG